MDVRDRTELDPGTLRDWLEQGEPVELIDIRPSTDYEAWHIPGSRNVDAYQAILTGRPGALAEFEANGDSPVVAICFVGQTSRVASQYLRSRGIPAMSLAGGMQGWSLAWNAAEVVLDGSQAQVLQVRRTGKGCLSYLVGSEGQAVVIDPSVEPDAYLGLAAENGWRITAVLDTHIHADHLSRARALAGMAHADHYLPRQDRVHFSFTPVEAGDVLEVGAARLEALPTPGHTLESMTIRLDDEVLFTGDTLFLDSVGRPDLKADRAGTKARARALHASLQELRSLPAELLVLPCHASRPIPFDRVPVAARLGEVAGRIDALDLTEAEFVSWILERIPPDPPNYQLIVQFNEAGKLPDLDPTIMEAGANRCAI